MHPLLQTPLYVAPAAGPAPDHLWPEFGLDLDLTWFEPIEDWQAGPVGADALADTLFAQSVM